MYKKSNGTHHCYTLSGEKTVSLILLFSEILALFPFIFDGSFYMSICFIFLIFRHSVRITHPK